MEKFGKNVIIPTYNRFKYLLNAIDSVVKQSYKNLEIIVINDNSTQKEYYEYDFTKVDSRITIIHLKENSRQKYKIPSPAANARNIGIDNSKGDYIAFLDDDDVWLPNKLEIQIKSNERKNLKCRQRKILLEMDHMIHQKNIDWEMMKKNKIVMI